MELPESRILIIITGGTICMTTSEDGYVPARSFLQSGLAPRPVFNDGSYPEPLEMVTDDNGARKAVQSLRTPVSAYSRRVRYSVYEFETLLDSSSIDAVGWDLIAKCIYRNYQLFDGFVVLHGTDSLAYTCSALSFMLQNLGKPVIFTGSQVPMMELQNDATDNLLGSLVIAGHFMIPEVCLFFNFKLYRGNRTTKISANDYAAFASPNYPPLATIAANKTNVNWDLVYRPTQVGPVRLRTSLSMAHVACLRVFPGIKPEMIEAVLKVDDLKGLILETFGAGNTPGGPDSAFNNVLSDAVQRGKVIINVTQCLSGTVSPIYAPATILGRAGVVFGQDMTSEAALTKLLYLLSLPDLSSGQIAAMMSRSLCGELTETSKTQFQHPTGILTPEMSRLTLLGYRIQEGDLVGAKEVLQGERGRLLNEADYSGNTPLHLAATSANIDILRELLSQGASVHLRNGEGHTPLALAAQAELEDHVRLLRGAGAHLHSDELGPARLLASSANSRAWRLAGVDS